MIRALLHAKTTVVAGGIVLHHIKKLHLRPAVENLEQISEDTESSEKDSPRNVCAKHISYIVYAEKNTDPQPELQRVRDGSQRAEIAAPEHVYQEASKYDKADGGD
jgi:hypothetical protein